MRETICTDIRSTIEFMFMYIYITEIDIDILLHACLSHYSSRLVSESLATEIEIVKCSKRLYEILVFKIPI